MEQPVMVPNTEQAINTRQKMEKEQKLLSGIIAGLIAAIIGAILWGYITIWLNWQIGWMSIGVGALVGLGVRIFGKGISIKFGIAGAILALLGCVLGNIFVNYLAISRAYEIPLFDVIKNIPFKDVIDLFKATFEWIDILFYAIALVAGYQFSIRKVK
jgi:hypothetical protein